MYVKIFASILDSSVWHESPTTVKVWLTLLCMADREGHVRAVERAVAQRAVVSVDQCRKALQLLEAPDLDSQTQDFGGRRIDRMEGGWVVLNYVKYRELRTEAQVREAKRKSRQRAKSKGRKKIETPPPVAAGAVPGHVPHVPANATASAPEDGVVPAVPRAGAPGTLLAEFADTAAAEAYQAYRRGHRYPDGLDATLRAVHAPAAGGAAYPWAVIGAALVEMRGASADFTPNALRAFCRRIGEVPPASAPGLPHSYVASERAAARRAAIAGGGA